MVQLMLLRTAVLLSGTAIWLSGFETRLMFAQETNTALRDRFIDGVKRTEAKVAGLSFRVKCETESGLTRASDKVIEHLKKQKRDPLEKRLRSYEVAVQGDSTLKLETARNGTESVMAKNSNYAFRIERSPIARQYGLTFVSQLGESAESDKQIEQMEMQGRVFPLFTWYMCARPLSHFVRSPAFKIKNISSTSSDGEELVRVDFEHLIDDPDRKKEWLKDAYLVCDPARDWALKEYRATLEDGSVYHVTIDFGESVDGFPIPRQLTCVRDNDNASCHQSVAKIKLVSGEVRETDFHLGHYGLPEPNFGQGWFGSWVWYLIVGIVCLVVGGAILKRRGSAR